MGLSVHIGSLFFGAYVAHCKSFALTELHVCDGGAA